MFLMSFDINDVDVDVVDRGDFVVVFVVRYIELEQFYIGSFAIDLRI